MLNLAQATSNDNEENHALLERDEYEIVCEYVKNLQSDEEAVKPEQPTRTSLELEPVIEKIDEYFSDCIEFTDYESDAVEERGQRGEISHFAAKSDPIKRQKH